MYLGEEKKMFPGENLREKKSPLNLVSLVPKCFCAQPYILNKLKCILERNQTSHCKNDLFITKFLCFASSGNLLHYTPDFNVHILKGETRCNKPSRQSNPGTL